MSDAAPNSDFKTLLDFLDETPKRLTNFTAGLSNAEFRWQNSPDEFSALENICHLRDLELQGYTPRIRRILAEANPALADFEGTRVAAESNYQSEQPAIALKAFETARRENVAVLRALTEGQLERVGALQGVGRITLKRLAEMMREHDEGHLEDLRVLRQKHQNRER
jgi:hypothetical protein